MKALIYNVTPKEPVLATRLEGDPNSAVSYDYLPGSVLRGMAIARYLAKHAPAITTENLLTQPDSTVAAQIRRLFFDGSTRYLNGYPVAKKERALPMPHSWQRDKNAAGVESNTVYDGAIRKLETDGSKSWKRFGGGFWIDDSGQVRKADSARVINIHTQRERNAGRPRSGAGAVFRYDALAEGQTFQTVVVCDDADAAELKTLIGDEKVTTVATLGGSRNAGYGQVTITFVSEEAVWQEAKPIEPAAKDALRVTLLSDAIIRDAHGQISTDAQTLTEAISSALGLTQALEIDVQRSFVSIGQVGGFNRKWGLPLTQAHVFQAGSVLTFKRPVDTDLKTTLLAQNGIGERRVEGFGRIAVNWLSADTWTLADDLTTNAGGSEPMPDLDAASQRLARTMAKRLLERRLYVQVAAAAGRVTLVPRSAPNKSQLARLRGEIMKQLEHWDTKDGADVTLKFLDAYLKDVNDRSVTRRQFERARVEIEGSPKALVGWIEGAKQDYFASVLKFDEIENTQVAGEGGVPDAKLRAKYCLLLLAEVLKRAAKNNQE